MTRRPYNWISFCAAAHAVGAQRLPLLLRHPNSSRWWFMRSGGVSLCRVSRCLLVPSLLQLHGEVCGCVSGCRSHQQTGRDGARGFEEKGPGDACLHSVRGAHELCVWTNMLVGRSHASLCITSVSYLYPIYTYNTKSRGPKRESENGRRCRRRRLAKRRRARVFRQRVDGSRRCACRRLATPPIMANKLPWNRQN